jgi:hypothetical protein
MTASLDIQNSAFAQRRITDSDVARMTKDCPDNAEIIPQAQTDRR